MTAARLRLLIAFAVFAGWVAWLATQALTRGRFPVLSRAQLLISTIDLIGVVKADPDGRPATLVNVQEVHWPTSGSPVKAGDLIQIVDLPETRGFAGSGLYILALVPAEKSGEYRVAGLPPSPGFESFPSPLFIYPLTPVTRQQLDAIPKRHP